MNCEELCSFDKYGDNSFVFNHQMICNVCVSVQYARCGEVIHSPFFVVESRAAAARSWVIPLAQAV